MKYKKLQHLKYKHMKYKKHQHLKYKHLLTRRATSR